jgi:hypothetical protein
VALTLPGSPALHVRRKSQKLGEESMKYGWARMIVIALVLSATWTATTLADPSPGRSGDPRPVVVRAAVDQLEPDRLVIRGTNFGVSSAPVVLLSKVALEVLSFSDEQIIARLPIDTPPARYRLQVLAHGTPSASVEITLFRRPMQPMHGREG